MGKPKAPTQTSNTTSSQTQTSTPWAPVEPLLQDMATRAQAAMGATPNTPVYTGPNADQRAAVDMLRGMAPGLAQGAGQVGANASAIAGGNFLNPANNQFMGTQVNPGVNMRNASAAMSNPVSGQSTLGANPFTLEATNPHVEAAIQASIAPLRQQLDQNVLSIGDAAKLSGAYGGDRQELMKGTALGQFNRDAMQMATGTRMNAYESAAQRALAAWNATEDRSLSSQEAALGRNFAAGENRIDRMTGAEERGIDRAFTAGESDIARRQQEWQNQLLRMDNVASMFGQANQLGMEPARVLGGIGDQQSQWDLAKAQAAIDAPWAGMDRYAQIISQFSPYGTTSTNGTSQTVGKATAGGGGVGGGLSGALGGASAGAAFGPWGAGIGAVLGGLGGLFG